MKTDLKKRDRLAYLALYYAINGDTKRSERVRHLVSHLDSQALTDAKAPFQIPTPAL